MPGLRWESSCDRDMAHVDNEAVDPTPSSTSKKPGMDNHLTTAPAAAFSTETAHRVGTDSWLQVGFVLVTSFNSAYVLSYPKLVMTGLGWVGGGVGMLLVAAMSFEANYLLAKLHEVGGKRRIRYRDIALHVYGPAMSMLSWILQYTYLLIGNIGFIILAGEALKAIYLAYDTNPSIHLNEWILVGGASCFAFAFVVPHLSALRTWLGISAILTLTYATIVLVLAISHGGRSKVVHKDYRIHGTQAEQVFGVIASVSNIITCYNSNIIPELQATLKPPAAQNMLRALVLQFTLGNSLVYMVTFVGYWAYGSAVSSYLVNDVNGSATLTTIANTAVFLQTLISLHVFASPVYEFFDTKFGRMDEKRWSLYNTLVRLVARGSYIGVSTFIAALLPFLGDFVILAGALSCIPLTFILGHHMYLKVHWTELSIPRKTWHCSNVVAFTLLSVAATITGIRSIVVDSTTYRAFADV